MLNCDASNSAPLSSVQWLNPQSTDRYLVIVNIQRNAAGVYTCVATSNDGEIMNSTANIIVQCECVFVFESSKLQFSLSPFLPLLLSCS